MSEASSPRVPPLRREELTDPAREVCAFWGEPNAWEEGSKTNVINVMAQHPPLGKVYNEWGRHFLMNNSLALRQLELIVLRVAWRVKSEYEWHNHVGYAINCGITLEEIKACQEEPVVFAWAEQDRAVLDAVDDLIDTNRIGDATWAALSRFYNRQQLMDLTFTVGHYVMTSWALSTFEVGIEHADPIGWDLKHKSGTIPGATYKPMETEDWTSTRGY
ncbi:MAG: carboxymuconolactone decarboxylase family protein [Sphingobium sp.]